MLLILLVQNIKAERTGSLADITVFSYHAVKNLTTAEGGAICITMPPPFDNADIYKTLRFGALTGKPKMHLPKASLVVGDMILFTRVLK